MTARRRREASRAVYTASATATRKEMIPERQMIMGVDGDREAAERAVAALDARPGHLERMVDGWLMGRDGEAHQPPINHPRPNLTAARREAKVVDGG